MFKVANGIFVKKAINIAQVKGLGVPSMQRLARGAFDPTMAASSIANIVHPQSASNNLSQIGKMFGKEEAGSALLRSGPTAERGLHELRTRLKLNAPATDPLIRAQHTRADTGKNIRAQKYRDLFSQINQGLR